MSQQVCALPVGARTRPESGARGLAPEQRERIARSLEEGLAEEEATLVLDPGVPVRLLSC